MEQISYRGDVAVAFEVLAEGLAPFIDRRMSRQYPDDDWVLMAANKLGKRPDVLVSLSDPHFQLEVLNRWWGPAFSAVLDESMRDTITDLRTARNHWAHPDEDHPFDHDYALKVHTDVEELLRSIDSDMVSRITELLADLRWRGVQDKAQREGRTEEEELMDQFLSLQEQYDTLRQQLDQAKEVARSATGRTRAVARQLAELQSQYAAASQLSEQYEKLQQQMARGSAVVEEGRDEAEVARVRDQPAPAERALVTPTRESEPLREQPPETRRSIAQIDPIETEVGRRWIWLVTVLVLMLGLLVLAANYAPR